MGVNNLPWKKIIRYVSYAIFAVLVGIFGPMIGWNWLPGWIKGSVRFLTSPIGRDVILFLLIGYVLYVIFKRRKGSPVSKEEFDDHRKAVRNFEGEFRESIKSLRQDLAGVYDTAKKYVRIEPREKAIFILKTVGGRFNHQMPKGELYVRYLKEFGFTNKSVGTLDFNTNITWLKKRNLISEAVVESDNVVEYILIEDVGFEYLELAKKKLAEEKKAQGSDKK